MSSDLDEKVFKIIFVLEIMWDQGLTVDSSFWNYGIISRDPVSRKHYESSQVVFVKVDHGKFRWLVTTIIQNKHCFRLKFGKNVLSQSSGRPNSFIRINNEMLFRIKSWSLRI